MWELTISNAQINITDEFKRNASKAFIKDSQCTKLTSPIRFGMAFNYSLGFTSKNPYSLRNFLHVIYIYDSDLVKQMQLMIR